jgi:hypothetical protein
MRTKEFGERAAGKFTGMPTKAASIEQALTMYTEDLEILNSVFTTYMWKISKTVQLLLQLYLAINSAFPRIVRRSRRTSACFLTICGYFLCWKRTRVDLFHM